MPKIICPGCSVSFKSNQRWSNHLAQTNNEPCRAVRRQQGQYLPGAAPDASSPTHSQTFAGDFFGNDYIEQDFPWGNDPEAPVDHDDDSDEPESEDSPGWEPTPRPFAASVTDSSDSDDEMEEEYGRLLTREERQNAEKTQQSAPVIDLYPSARAGEIISDAESDAGYGKYEGSLASASVDNPYAPFSSKLDWEFARWAKLRGAGSTAVTELMGIEGVHFRSFIRCNDN